MSKDLTEALRALMESSDQPAPEAPKTRGSAPPAKSASALIGKASGGGVASPLTELNFTLREYHTTSYRTTDGLFAFPALKKLKMTDANNEPVELIFAAPV